MTHRGLEIQNLDRLVVDPGDLVVIIADHGQTHLPELRQRANHVEEHARFGAVAVVHAVHREDVEEVFGQDAAIALRSQVVGGAIVLRALAERHELAGRGVQVAAGQEAQREERVRRADEAQVDLERGDAPVVVGPFRHARKSMPKRLTTPWPRQHMADAPARVADLQAVPVLRGEVAA